MASNEASIGLRIYLEDAITSGLNNITSLFNDLATNVKENSTEITQAFEEAAKSAQTLQEPLAEDAVAAEEAAKSVNTVSDAFQALSEYQSVPQALADSLADTTKSAEDTAKSEQDLAQSSSDAAQNMLLQVLQAKVLQEGLMQIQQAMEDVGVSAKQYDAITAETNLLAKASETGAIGVEQLAAAMTQVEEAVRVLTTSEDAFFSTQQKVAQANQQTTVSFQDMADEEVRVAGWMDMLAEKMKESTASAADLDKITQATNDFVKALDAGESSVDTFAQNINRAIQAIDDLNKAQADAAAQAQNAIYEKEAEDLLAMQQSIQQASAAMATNTDVVLVNKETQQALIDELDLLETAEDGAGEGADRLNGSMGALMMAQQGLQQVSQLFKDGFNQASQAASDLEMSVTRVGIATGITGPQLDKMRQYIVDVANASTFSADDVGAAFERLGERGFSATEITSGMGQSLVDFAEATHSEFQPASDLLIEALRTFGGGAQAASDYADKLTYAFMHGIPDVTQLEEGLRNVGGTAASLHIPFDQVIASLDYLVNNGMPNASMAGNSLRYMLQGIADPTSTAAKEFAALGLIATNTSPQMLAFADSLTKASKTPIEWDGTLTSLQQIYNAALKLGTIHTDKNFMDWAVSIGAVNSNLYDNGQLKALPEIYKQIGDAIRKLPKDEQPIAEGLIMNTRAGQGGKLILADPSSPQNIKKLVDGVKNSVASKPIELPIHGRIELDPTPKQGLAQQAAGELHKTFAVLMQELTTSLHTLFGNVGQTINDTLKPLLPIANQLVGYFNSDKADGVRKFFAGFLLVGGIVAPLAAFGGMIAIIIALSSAVAVILGWVMVVIIGLALAGGFIVSHWSQVVGVFNNVVGFFKSMGVAMMPVINMIGASLMPALRAAGQTIMSALGPALKSIGPLFHTVVVALSALTPAFNVIKVIFLVIVNLVVAFALLFVGNILGMVNGVIRALGVLIAGVIGAIAAIIGVFTGFITLIIGIFTLIIGLVTFNGDMIKKGFMQIGSGILTILLSLGTLIITIITTVLSAVLALFGGYLQGMLGFFGRLANMFSQGAGDGMIRFGDAIANGLNIAVQFFAGLPGRIMTALGNLGTMMFNSGTNAMQMLGNGIMSAIGQVGNAISQVTGYISSHLGFHSPTKEGPLSESGEYMPNMMKMYGAGIRANMHHVTGPVGDIAHAIATGINTPTIAKFQTSAAYSSSQANSNTQTINLHIDGKQVSQVVMDNLTGQLKMNGLGRAWR